MVRPSLGGRRRWPPSDWSKPLPPPPSGKYRNGGTRSEWCCLTLTLDDAGKLYWGDADPDADEKEAEVSYY